MPRPCVGEKYGRLTVDSFIKVYIESQKRTRTKLICQCDCGNKHTMDVSEFRRGRTHSCGCLKRENGSKRKTHGMSDTKIYAIWSRMVNRTDACLSKRDVNYQYDYIDREEKWDTFEGFYEDMSATYFDGASIDRVNPKLGYSKENCRWVTMAEQGRNKGKNKRNKTGVTGVHYRKTKYGNEYFVCSYRENGKEKVTLFSIDKLGHEEAFKQAIAAREAAMARLIDMNIGYTTHHGK